jgi:probable H4MPT-linked C1 transfer pathway protein
MMSMPPNRSDATIGWDVGGAHVKAARVEGSRITGVVQLPCPLWLGLEHLPGALAEAQARLGPAPLHAATMTGELADAFPGRAEGVAHIAAALARAARPATLRLYAGRAGFLDPTEAAAQADSIASANWHATAALAGRFVPYALLVDMGSTTTDLIPVAAGRPAGAGYTDAERMACGELVYTGLVRTPVMALCRRAPFAGAWTPLANELFATAADAYRVLGELPEGADQMATADGRGKTADLSRARLARMVGRDAGDASPEAWRDLAAWLAEAQLRQVADAAGLALSRMSLPHDAPVLGAGVGRHVAARLAARLGRPYRDYAALPPLAATSGAADCAPAVAVALLACPA